MKAPLVRHRLADGLTRRAVVQGGALMVGFALTGLQSQAVAERITPVRSLNPTEVDAFLTVNGDGTVTLFCGKVDLVRACA